jgi:hypothetical protein
MPVTKKTPLAIIVVIFIIIVGGSWYLWVQGIIGKNPSAPSNENFMKALQTLHLNEEQRSMIYLSPPGRCIKLPPALSPDKYDVTELVPIQVPGQYLYRVTSDAEADPIQLGVRKTLQALTKAGFLEETVTGNGVHYRLTWAAAPYISIDPSSTQFCAQIGRFGPLSIIRSKKNEAGPSSAVRYDVTYRLGLVEPSEWLGKPGVKELLKDILQNSSAISGEEITRQLVRGKDGWIVEKTPIIIEKGDAKSRFGGNASGPLLEGYFRDSVAELDGTLVACLPLPDMVSSLQQARALPEHIVAEYRESYVAPDLMFDRTGIFEGDRHQMAGRQRLLRRLAKHGVVVGETIDDATWPKREGTLYGVIGGTIYRVAPELQKYIVRRNDFDMGDVRDAARYCLRFAERDIRIIQSRFIGFRAPGSEQPSYQISGRIVPINILEWFKPLLEARNIAEASAIADGLFFRGRVDHAAGKLRLGTMHVSYPRSIASPFRGGPMQALVSRIEIRTRIATSILDHRAPKDFLANDPAMLNRFINDLRDDPRAIAKMRGQCNERRQMLLELRDPLAELQADEEYRPMGAYLAKLTQKKRAEVDAFCEGMLRKFNEIFRVFPHLRTPSIDAQLRNDPPPTRTLTPDPFNVPRPAQAPLPAPAPNVPPSGK